MIRPLYGTGRLLHGPYSGGEVYRSGGPGHHLLRVIPLFEAKVNRPLRLSTGMLASGFIRDRLADTAFGYATLGDGFRTGTWTRAPPGASAWAPRRLRRTLPIVASSQ